MFPLTPSSSHSSKLAELFWRQLRLESCFPLRLCRLALRGLPPEPKSVFNKLRSTYSRPDRHINTWGQSTNPRAFTPFTNLHQLPIQLIVSLRNRSTSKRRHTIFVIICVSGFLARNPPRSFSELLSIHTPALHRMAPLRSRTNEGDSFSSLDDRGRNVGIIFGCVAAVVLLLYSMSVIEL